MRLPIPLARRAIVPALLLAAIAAQAAAPRTIPVQGRLHDPSGAPISGDRSLTFRLYADPAGGAALWSETDSVPVQNGTFHAMLGDGVPFPSALTFAQPYYLGISVGDDGKMAPRLPLASVPYALALPNVVVTPGGNVGVGTTAPGSRLTVAGAVESTSAGFRFPDGTVQSTAADPGRFARAPYLAGFVSGLAPSAYRLDILINGALQTPPATLAEPYTSRLDRVRVLTTGSDGKTIVQFLPGRMRASALVLRRRVSRNRSWSNWHDAVTLGDTLRHDVEIRLMEGEAMRSRWMAQDGWVSRYRLRLADDGLPVEEIAFEFDGEDRLRRTVSPGFPAALPTTAANAGYLSGLSPFTHTYRVTLDGDALEKAVIVADAGVVTEVNELIVGPGQDGTVRRIPGHNDPGTVTVRQNPGAGTDLNEWFERFADGEISDRVNAG